MKLRILSLLLFGALTLSSSAKVTLPDAKYVAWKVATPSDVAVFCNHFRNGVNRCCGWDNDGFSINDDAQGSGLITIVARMNRGTMEKIKLFDGQCDVSRQDAQIAWLQNVSTADSLDLLSSQLDREDADTHHIVTAMALHDGADVEPRLEQIANSHRDDETREQAIFWIGQRGGDRGYRYLTNFLKTNDDRKLLEKAVFALSQSKAAGATESLIDVARHHERSNVRRQAIFWLGQKAGAKAAAELRRTVDEDPDDDVKEHAVFAISQLPRDRSVPMLIDLVKTHKSPRVREKAMFWLAQTGDPRALDLIEQIVLK